MRYTLVQEANFNPHPLWRGWLCLLSRLSQVSISIHTLCEEGDLFLTTLLLVHFLFQSTPSVKRVTDIITSKTENKSISIHTLCEEGDVTSSSSGYLLEVHFNPHPLWRGWRASNIIVNITVLNFNPHPLWRGWHSCLVSIVMMILFQSTPSVKRVTSYSVPCTLKALISIHTLCEEGDIQEAKKSGITDISIHTLCEEGDVNTSLCGYVSDFISIHTLCEEGDISKRIFLYKNSDFNPHPLWRGWRCVNINIVFNKIYFNPHPLWRGWLLL